MNSKTPSDYNERKSIFIARATRHFDTPQIRKEAAEMFDSANRPKKESMAKRIGKFLKSKIK